MKSCQDYLSELRQKIDVAEDQVRLGKKNLYKTQELFTEEKDKWNAEIKEDEHRIRFNESEIKAKEEKLEQVRAEYEEILKRATQLEGENEKLKKDLQKAKIVQQDRMNKFLLEQANLEKELNLVLEQQKDLKVSNKWAKIFQEREMRAHETEQENHLKEEIKQLSDDFAKKIEAFDESLKEIDLAGLGPKQKRLATLQEILEHISNECKDYEEKNKTLEKQIEMLEKL